MIRRIFFRFTTILIFFFLAMQSKACLNLPCDLEKVADTLQQPELSHFKQEKNIKVLSQPLFSEGYLLLDKEHKLVWQTIKPIKSTTVITDSSFLQFNKKDEPLSLPKNTDNGSGKVFAATFMNILAGDFDKLSDSFKVDSSCNKGGWSINLTPTTKDVSKLIKHINIQGNDTIHQVKFTESNDDVTRLVFKVDHSSKVKQELRQYLEY